MFNYDETNVNRSQVFLQPTFSIETFSFEHLGPHPSIRRPIQGIPDG